MLIIYMNKRSYLSNSLAKHATKGYTHATSKYNIFPYIISVMSMNK
jgi:hypothetical protein